jgi:hypothetical protein
LASASRLSLRGITRPVRNVLFGIFYCCPIEMILPSSVS